MSNLIYSINATLPIFLLIILGKVLKTTKIINDEFTKTADRYVFRIALPALLFSDLTENNVGSAFDGKYVLFCFSVTIFSIAVLWGLTEKFMKNEEQKGAFIQGSYRSSAAILGLAFINNMYDSVGMAPLMIIGCVPLYNIFAVIILTWCTPCLTNPGKTQSMRPRVSRRWPPKPKSLRTASITRVSQSKPF